TSPIYALRESLHGTHGVSPTPENVLGLLSLIVWALVIVISIKYLAFVMRADNCGEGGMIALTALVTPDSARARLRRRRLLVLVSVFLVVTGGEALYADMGHFGARPIRLSWYFFVLPSLLLNYFGQGALVLLDPGAAEHPFFRLAPPWALLPLVGLATLAT